MVALEARGFLLGPLLDQLQNSFVPIRKTGKLPSDSSQTTSYTKEYGADQMEISQSALNKENHVVIVDALIATGGSMVAAVELVQSCGASVIECLTLMEIVHLKGRERLSCSLWSIFES